MRKFLVIGGMHGNEPLGIEVCKILEKLNLSYLNVLYANKRAIKENKRFTEEDLNRSFPGKTKGSYEVKRAREIIDICKNYDFVIDFHNTHCPNNDCGFVGEDDYKEAATLSSFMGLKRVIIANYDCINKYVKNCLSVEISLSSRRSDIDYWVQKMVNLKNFDPNKSYGKVDLYKFSYRITREQQDKYKFPKWKAFKRIHEKNLEKLHLKGKYYPIFVDDAYTPYNYAGLIQKIL